ncbi:MAG: glycosyltransferase [Anaerolineae bacterium]
MPEISIVLLTLNAGPALERTLDAIARQRTGRSFELVAIDSGSTDGTLELLQHAGARMERIPRAEFNFGRTRDRGYALGRGQYLVTLSQDAVPASDEWLEQLVAPFDDSAVAAVAGATLLPPPPALTFYWERVDRFYFTRESRRWVARYHFGFSNINSAVRKTVWEQNRIGPIEMSEDRLLFKTWTARGRRIVFAPNAAVYHAHLYDLAGLMRRCENEGLGCRQVGEPYTLVDCLADLANGTNWRLLLGSILRGARPRLAELAFPLVRPLWLWKGYRWNRHYAR